MSMFDRLARVSAAFSIALLVMGLALVPTQVAFAAAPGCMFGTCKAGGVPASCTDPTGCTKAGACTGPTGCTCTVGVLQSTCKCTASCPLIE
jgi:hypothetical protein